MKLKFYSFHDALTNGYSAVSAEQQGTGSPNGTMEGQRKQTE